MTKSTAKETVKGNLEYMQFITLDDSITDAMLLDDATLATLLQAGTVKRVRYNQDRSLYDGTDTTVYEYTASETVKGDDGKAIKGDDGKNVKQDVTRYAVAVNDAKRATSVNRVDSILVDIANGMSASEIALKYGNKK